MKKTINYFALSLIKLNKTHLQFAFMLLSLTMFVVGANLDDIGDSLR